MSKRTTVFLIGDEEMAIELFNDKQIVTLFYREYYKYKCFSRNLGDSKGENHYKDICVVLNMTISDNLEDLTKLKPQTKNKFYVACSRANNNLYGTNFCT